MAKTNANPDILMELKRHLGYLNSDPENASLLIDVVDLAIKANETDVALELLERYRMIEGDTPLYSSMYGLALMGAHKFKQAADIFRSLADASPEEPATQFNLAWCLAMEKDYEGAKQCLTPATVTALPQAATLQIELLHTTGNFDEAIAAANAGMATHADDKGLMAAVSVLAMDTDQPDLAAKCAAKAGNHPDALATLAALTLGDNDPNLALSQFDAALALNQHKPRAWVGKGLAQIAVGNSALLEDAAKNIDHGAKLFETHIGSWIAAGWAQLLLNDLAASRQRFEIAFNIDKTFAESHGALAVVDMLEGDFSTGQERLRRAMGLDRKCFSAALAQVLLLQSDGKTDLARKIFEDAINTPMDETGRTIAGALMQQGLS